MSLKTILHDFYDLTRLPLGIMAALAGLTTGMIVVLVEEEGESIFLPYQTQWHTINETNTLNYRAARTEDDERHLCPLQLDLIERCVRLWSNEGETVFSPFAGIGSEGFVSLKWNRKFVGTELKEEYYDCAIDNCNAAIEERELAKCQMSLF